MSETSKNPLPSPVAENGRNPSWLHRVAGWVQGHLGGNASLRESLEDVLESHTESGDTLSEEGRHMLFNIVGFGKVRVDDVMVPRADIVDVECETGLDELLAVFREANHSRIPVYRGTLDDPLGMVHIKDVVNWIAQHAKGNGKAADDGAEQAANDEEAFSLEALVRDVLFVPPSMTAIDLLLKMQATRIHLALVIDEFGGVDGLVSIEDLVEQIVGEIEDEHDPRAGPLIQQLGETTIAADARAEVDELEALIGIDLLPDEREEDIDTLGGLVFTLLGRVPQRGELVRHPGGIEFEITEADPRRIKRLLVHLPDSGDRQADTSGKVRAQD